LFHSTVGIERGNNLQSSPLISCLLEPKSPYIQDQQQQPVFAALLLCVLYNLWLEKLSFSAYWENTDILSACSVSGTVLGAMDLRKE
jgi:hypothetical protein